MASIRITGTSSGIGRQTALAFGHAGYCVAATMRNPDVGSGLVEAALREGLSLSVLPMDVDSDESVRQAMAQIGQAIGPIDGLVNNAGIDAMGPVEEFPLSAFRAVMETNYFARRRRSGGIINVASVAGQVAIAPMAADFGVSLAGGRQDS
jgi:NAD(P)-dependent dehydrogenase (short-subunit alcohol dehydrogenase family)